MTLAFSKYQGTGNDFIIIDNRDLSFSKDDTKLINHLCDRKFGIGADGLILLENHHSTDFLMVYYNADGRQSSMCGNGGRCIVAFAKALKIIDSTTTFTAIDGDHEAQVDGDMIRLKMQDVTSIEDHQAHTFLNTGSPHHIQLIENLDTLDVKTRGSELRYSKLYGSAGSNINFVQQKGANLFQVRTYERGVEDETLSCGTGVTAVAIAAHYQGWTDMTAVDLEVEGGKLAVSFRKNDNGYDNIFLVGPAQLVFKGTWE